MIYEVKVKFHVKEHVLTIKADNRVKLYEILRVMGFNSSDIVEIREVVM